MNTIVYWRMFEEDGKKVFVPSDTVFVSRLLNDHGAVEERSGRHFPPNKGGWYLVKTYGRFETIDGKKTFVPYHMQRGEWQVHGTDHNSGWIRYLLRKPKV